MVASTSAHAASSGTLVVLACPPALCPHLEFAVASVLERAVCLRWSAQPARPGTLTSRAEWGGTPGTAGRLAARLRALGPVYFDVVESASAGYDAERYAYSPELGLFRATIAAHGDIVVGEGPLRELLGAADSPTALAHGLERLLGTVWDEQLEPLRRGGDGAAVSWLPRTG